MLSIHLFNHSWRSLYRLPIQRQSPLSRPLHLCHFLLKHWVNGLPYFIVLRQKRRGREENSIFWDQYRWVGTWRPVEGRLAIGRARCQFYVLLQTDRPLDEYGWEQWKGWCGREDPPLQTDAGLNNACRLSLKTLRACISIFSDNWGSGQLQTWLGCCGEISFAALTDELDLGEKGRLAAFLSTTVAPMPRLMFRYPLKIVPRHWWRSDRGLAKQQISEWVSDKLFLSDLLSLSFTYSHFIDTELI